MRLNLLPNKYRQSPFMVSTPEGRKLAKEPRVFDVQGFSEWTFFTNAVPGMPGAIFFVATEAVSGHTLHAPGAMFLTRKQAETNARKALAAIGRDGLRKRIGFAVAYDRRAA